MKKTISIFLIIMTLTMVCTFNTFATENSVEKEKLGILVTYNDYDDGILGGPCVYDDGAAIGAYNRAVTVYEDETSDDTDYILARKTLLYATEELSYNYPEFVQYTYESALKEQNYNNFYTEEQWANFQNKLKALGLLLNSPDGVEKSVELNKAFQGVLRAYNEMTNAHTLKGDINKDGVVNVSDVTLLQKHLAGTAQLTGAQKMLAGAKQYEIPSITEATVIQKYCVGLIDEMPDYDVFIEDLDYDFMGKDFLLERILNFNICPRKSLGSGSGVYIENGYSGLENIYAYYWWCNEYGYEP